MAPKTLYNAAEVQQKVTETAEKAVKTLEEEGWEFSESTESPGPHGLHWGPEIMKK